jgi:NADP-dependent 3-hydroxy acid dehydrogenase YdfG
MSTRVALVTLTPLTAEDVAEVVAFSVTRPPHVDIDHVVLKPVAQASTTVTARR